MCGPHRAEMSDTDDYRTDAMLVLKAIGDMSGVVPGLSESLVLEGAPLDELSSAIRFLRDDLKLISGGQLRYDQEKNRH